MVNPKYRILSQTVEARTECCSVVNHIRLLYRNGYVLKKNLYLSVGGENASSHSGSRHGIGELSIVVGVTRHLELFGYHIIIPIKFYIDFLKVTIMQYLVLHFDPLSSSNL